MIQPSKPWPQPSSAQHDDMLSGLVASGDIARVRDYFDSVFWEGRKERPGWSHLRIALLREDRPMLRLLHTWGAMPTEADMAVFRTAAGEKYPAYVRLLRASGLRPENTQWQEMDFDPAKPTHDEIKQRAHEIYVASGSLPDQDVANWLKAEAEVTAKKRAALAKAAAADEALFDDITYKKDAAQMIDKVPQEWRLLVKAFHAGGSNEAVIAGGALRDLYNNREIKDVDIFLRSRGSQKKNRKFMEEVFAVAGLDIAKQKVGYSGYDAILERFPTPATSKRQSFAAAASGREAQTEAWKIVAGKNATEYNVIFVEDPADRKLAETVSPREQCSLFTGGLLGSFDIGLCQIACDGDDVVSTPAYRDDVKHKRVSLLRPGATSDDHMQRVANKYKDWDLNPAAKEALAPRPPRPVSRHYTSYY